MTDARERAPIRAADIKELNERLVLGMVFRTSHASQSEVALASGLKAPTVFRIFGELERKGLIAPVVDPPPFAPDRKGRRPTWYATVPGAYRVVGLDFRAGAASVVVEDFSSEILYAEERPIPYGADADEAYRVVSTLAADALMRAPGGPLLGIGIGAPGVVDLAKGAVLEYKRIPGLSGFPLAGRLEERFATTVRMGNNATVAALAAYRYGKECGADGISPESAPGHGQSNSFFALLVRSGVGGAFIRSGVPYENSGKTAIEIGHVIMDPSGPECACGGFGCLEAYLSEDALVEAAFHGSTTQSTGSAGGFEELGRLLGDGDATVETALEPAAKQASVALHSIRHLLDPDEFIVISRSAPLSTYLATATGKYLAAHPRPDGSSPRVRGYLWDPILAGRAACDMVFDGFFV
ncbi:MAG: ROK family transcriptional regulator [Spirochaetales bacterium]|nr:ROK family transcriptional regulator [Spirochaetales bacterium]